MIGIVGQVLQSVLVIYLAVLLGHVVFSWVPRPPEPLVPVRLGLAALVEPVVGPLRRVIPPIRLGSIALDWSIILVFIAIRLLLMPLAARLAAVG